MTTGVLLHLTELKGQINVCDRAKGPCHWSIMCVHVSERVLEMMCFYSLLLSSELLQRNRLLINSDFWHSEITVRVIGHQQKNVRCNCGFYKNCSFSAWTGHMRLNKDIKQDTYLISYLLFLTCSLKVICKVFLYCHFHLKFILKRSSWLLVSWTKAACITWGHEHYVSNKFSHLTVSTPTSLRAMCMWVNWTFSFQQLEFWSQAASFDVISISHYIIKQ